MLNKSELLFYKRQEVVWSAWQIHKLQELINVKVNESEVIKKCCWYRKVFFFFKYLDMEQTVQRVSERENKWKYREQKNNAYNYHEWFGESFEPLKMYGKIWLHLCIRICHSYSLDQILKLNCFKILKPIVIYPYCSETCLC